MSDTRIFDIADNVKDAASFVVFLDALRINWEQGVLEESVNPSRSFSSMQGWENTNIGSFLEAAVAGAQDNQIHLTDAGTNVAEAWKLAASIILLGKVYE
mgnify:CR=1 FL=1